MSSDSRRSIAVLAVILLAVVACGGSGAESDATTETESTVSDDGTDTTDAGDTDTTQASEELPFEVVTEGCLTVTYSENYLPKIASGSDGTALDGYEGYLMERVAEKYGLDICPLPLEFGSQILSVKEGQADVGTGIYYREERAQQVFYTRPNIVDLQGVVIPEDFPYEGPESLSNIGTFQGSATNEYLVETMGEENVLVYPGYAEALQAVLNNQADAYAGSTGTAPGAIQNYPQLTFRAFETGDFGMAEDYIRSATYEYVNCSNQALADVIDETLQELIDSGEWAEQRAMWGVEGEEYDPPAERPEQFCTDG